MKKLLAFLILLTSCATPNATLTATTQPARWNIEYSVGMPSQPAASGAGWYFDFPVETNFPACVETNSCKLVGYVVTPYTGAATKAVSMTFKITTVGSPVFNYALQSNNTCSTPASVHLLLQRRGDNLTAAYYRWWSNPSSVILTETEATITVPLTPDNWSSVYGEEGDATPAATAGFQAALANLGNIGMTFGGGCFFGHGVSVSNGTARFTLIKYTIYYGRLFNWQT